MRPTKQKSTSNSHMPWKCYEIVEYGGPGFTKERRTLCVALGGWGSIETRCYGEEPWEEARLFGSGAVQQLIYSREVQMQTRFSDLMRRARP